MAIDDTAFLAAILVRGSILLYSRRKREGIGFGFLNLEEY